MSEIIEFDDPVVLVGGGDIDQKVLQKFARLPIVAADGGAEFLRQLSLVPVAVIGDLDSIKDKDYWQKTSRVIEIAEQDTTDFEKCLYSIQAPWIVATGFTGSRFDHTLAALHVMQKHYREKSVVLVSGDDVVFVSSSAMELQLPVGTRVSLYPLKRTSFEYSAGLFYPLDQLTLQSGEIIGTSNCSSEPTVKIVPKPDGGCFALILPVSELDAVTQFIKTGLPGI